MDRLGRVGLFRRQVAFGVLGQLVGKDEQRIERRAQFVRHVGEEFRFVFRRQGQLFGLVFEFLAGLFDFGVLALDLVVLLRQQAGLFLQGLVGLLKLFLAGLELLRQGLRLGQQVFGAHIGLNRVEHDADRFRQLVEQGLVRRIEAFEGRQFEHALGLAFKDQRQDHDRARRR